MRDEHPIYCCIPIEFIQPWDQNEAIRQVKQYGLGNMVLIEGTFHVGNSDEERRNWKERFPYLADKVDATPRFPERPEHGMAAVFDLPVEFRIEQLELCRELGLQVLCFAVSPKNLPPNEQARLFEAGEGVVFCEPIMSENTSMLAGTLSLDRLKDIDAKPVAGHSESYFTQATQDAGPSMFDDPETLDFQAVHDWFVGRFRAHGKRTRLQWKGPLCAIEASAQMRLAMEAGVDVPIFELVPSEPLRGLASTRGAAKAYGKPLWGVHTAMGYYRAPADMWTPERLRIAYDLFFAGGASIFSEPNMPLRNWGSCSAFFTIQGSPPIREGEQECRQFDDPICVRAREVVAEHYRFTQFHQRPERGPRVMIGFLLGHLDGWTGYEGERMWMVDHPGFLAPDALQTWRHFERAYDTEPWYVPPHKYYWQADPGKPLRPGTPPCGQMDVVPVEAPLEVLKGYDCLVFLGWNTMTEEQYAKLKTYVEHGGTLFLSVPHLSTRTRADRPQEFIRGGDVRELCGVRILGPGEDVEEVLFAEQSRDRQYRFPRGTLYLEEAPLAAVELHGARVLAHPRGKPDQPVLLEHRPGKGVVYLLATWQYPGTRLDALITDILRTLAEGQQAEIAVESRDVFYAVYDGEMPSGLPFSMVYVVNHDVYGQPAYPALTVRGEKLPLRVGRELRIAWVCEDLVIAPHDRFVKVTDIRREGSSFLVMLESTPPGPETAPDEERLIQIEAVRGSVGKVQLDGRALACEARAEGDRAVRCRLSCRNVLRAQVGGA